MWGGIRVKAATGKEVVVTTQSRRDRHRRRLERDTTGLIRLSQPAGLTLEEENNVITVSARRLDGANAEIEVPAASNLMLRTLNGGTVTVEGVNGEIDVTNVKRLHYVDRRGWRCRGACDERERQSEPAAGHRSEADVVHVL